MVSESTLARAKAAVVRKAPEFTVAQRHAKKSNDLIGQRK